MVQKKLPLINSAHGSETRNIINELIKLFNGMGYTYDEALSKAHDVLEEAQKTNNMNKDVQRQINNLILSDGESDAEVIQARGTHTTLNNRLNELNTFVGDASILGNNYRSISESLKERGVNVKDFGAKGDGITNDSQAFIQAVNAQGTGIVYIPPGNYVVQNLPLKTGLFYIGSGMNSTTLTLPDNPSYPMFKAISGIEDIEGGGVIDLYARGNKTDNRADKNAFDFSSLSRLERFEIQGVKAEFFDIAYNGTDNDRWAYITNTQFYRNRIAIYAGEHPILVNVDCRSNDIGLTGRLNDLTALNCRFNYNRIGAEPAEGTGKYLNNCIFQNTGFWGNSEKGIEIGTGNMILNTRMSSLTSSPTGKGIVINGGNNKISEIIFGQSESTSFPEGAIVFEGDKTAPNNNTISDCFFNLAGGPGIVLHKSRAMSGNKISDNRIYTNSGNMHPFIPANSVIFRNNEISSNTFVIGGNLGTSVVNIPFVQSGGNKITDNTFVAGATAKLEYFLDIDARSSVIKDNTFSSHSKTEMLGLYNFNYTNSETIFKDNQGVKEEKLTDKGKATIPAGSFHVVVPVNVDKSLSSSGISVVPQGDLGSGGRFWISNISLTQFYIYRAGNTDESISFSWQVDLT